MTGQAMWSRIAQDAVKDVRGYLRGQTGIALMNGIVVGIAAAILGVPAAVAIGVVNFFGAFQTSPHCPFCWPRPWVGCWPA